MRLKSWRADLCLVLCVVCFATSATWLTAQNPSANEGSTENPFPAAISAPGLEGGAEWLNTSGPITPRDLQGKVVLLDFWTYCCINCIHILPDLKYLEDKYPNQLVVIGVHAAKFENEKDTENIREAIMRYEISHPVVNDSNMAIATRYGFNTWPTVVLIDPEGNFVGKATGEGNREVLDTAIAKLVKFHRTKGTLDETPVKFNLEREQQAPTALRYPGKLVTDAPNNRIFISDSNYNRIVIASLTGELLGTVGTGRIGKLDGDFATAEFNRPQGMALVGDKLYVADTENHLLRVVNLDSKTVTTLAGTGQQSTTRNRGGKLLKVDLNSPWDLQVLDNTLYIAMAGPHQLWKHSLNSDHIEVFAGSGREDIIDGSLTAAALAQPSGITTNGKVLFHVDSEGSAVRVVDPKADTVKTVVGPHDLPRGRSLFEFGDIDSVSDTARLQHPLGILFHEGKLLVTDTYNHKIKIIDPQERSSLTWLGDGNRGDGLKPVRMSEPSGLAVAGQDLFIADTNNHRILKTNLQTRDTTEFVVAGLAPPQPPRVDVDQPYRGQHTDVAAKSLAPGQSLPVNIKFNLPAGFKLNQLAPLHYEWKVDGNLVADPAALARKRMSVEGTAVRFELPLAAEAATGTLTLTVSYQFCRDGVGGVCRSGEHRWTIPVTLKGDGAKVLDLIAKP